MAFVAQPDNVMHLTQANLDKHEATSDPDTECDANSVAAIECCRSEVSSERGEPDRRADCGYHTDDDMYHPVYYMAIPPQIAPGTFVPVLPRIPQSPMSVSSAVPKFQTETPSNSSSRPRRLSLSSCAGSQGTRWSESETMEDKPEVQHKRMQKTSTSAVTPECTQPASVDRRGADEREPELDESERTTVMLKNLPKGLSRSMLLELLEQKGFSEQVNFVYLPVEFTRRSCMGYAFVNFEHPSMVAGFWDAFEGLTQWPVPSSKICRVTWSSPLQGLTEHVERFRNSPLMHSSVPDECRPILLRSGVRASFPAPTKTLRAPRPRASRSMRPFWQGENGDADTEAL